MPRAVDKVYKISGIHNLHLLLSFNQKSKESWNPWIYSRNCSLLFLNFSRRLQIWSHEPIKEDSDGTYMSAHQFFGAIFLSLHHIIKKKRMRLRFGMVTALGLYLNRLWFKPVNSLLALSFHHSSIIRVKKRVKAFMRQWLYWRGGWWLRVNRFYWSLNRGLHP